MIPSMPRPYIRFWKVSPAKNEIISAKDLSSYHKSSLCLNKLQTKGLSLIYQSLLQTLLMGLFLFRKNRFVESFLVFDEMIYDSGQFVSSCRDRLWRPMSSAHSSEIIAKEGFAAP